MVSEWAIKRQNYFMFQYPGHAQMCCFVCFFFFFLLPIMLFSIRLKHFLDKILSWTVHKVVFIMFATLLIHCLLVRLFACCTISKCQCCLWVVTSHDQTIWLTFNKIHCWHYPLCCWCHSFWSYFISLIQYSAKPSYLLLLVFFYFLMSLSSSGTGSR